MLGPDPDLDPDENECGSATLVIGMKRQALPDKRLPEWEEMCAVAASVQASSHTTIRSRIRGTEYFVRMKSENLKLSSFQFDILQIYNFDSFCSFCPDTLKRKHLLQREELFKNACCTRFTLHRAGIRFRRLLWNELGGLISQILPSSPPSSPLL
jgi:hypothetical protein